MIGAHPDQLPLPLDADYSLEPATVAGSPCCTSPYCSGCTAGNFLSTDESQLMRAYLRRLTSRPPRRQASA